MGTQIPTLYLLLAAVIGVFIGLLIASLFGSRESRNKKEPPQEVVKEGFGEVAGLWYSPAGKKLLLEMEGGHYKEFSSLSKEQQARAIRLAELLKEWVVKPVETAVTTAPVAVEQVVTPIVPEVQAEPAEPDMAAEIDLDLIREEGLVEDEEAVTPFVSEEHEDADVVSVLQDSLEVEEAFETEKSSDNTALTITQQIGAILDDMLVGTELEEKNIRLWENADHGVDVWVGSEKFEGIEAVPYPQVRQVIRDAVLRWEQETESQRRINE